MQELPSIIPAGTQVVSRLEVRGSQGARVHPRGGVSIITRKRLFSTIGYYVKRHGHFLLIL